MNETSLKEVIRDSETSSLAAAGISLACLLVILSDESDSLWLLLALCCFSVAMPIFVGLAFFYISFRLLEGELDSSRISLKVKDNKLLLFLSAASYLLVVFGVGFLIRNQSDISAYLYIAACVMSLIAVLTMIIGNTNRS